MAPRRIHSKSLEAGVGNPRTTGKRSIQRVHVGEPLGPEELAAGSLGDEKSKYGPRSVHLDHLGHDVLERMDRGGVVAGPALPSFVFGRPILISISERWYPTEEDEEIAGFFCSLDVAGSSTTSITIKKNGVAVGSAITIPSAANTTDSPKAVSLTAKVDYLQVEITGIGTGAKALTVSPYRV